ncbi:MAG: MTH938/NDUFAF3 family protein [Planctomycetaceae bacterium]|nr:MTH938/NDUFAF3 family protein [Planctomycetaceae bacterium]
MTSSAIANTQTQLIQIQTPKAALEAAFCAPENARGTIIFAYDAGDRRQNPQNERIAEMLQQEGFATLLFDLLMDDEERLDVLGKLSFDIPLLAGRLDCAAEWVCRNESTSGLPMGYFGAGTGAAAALVASLQRPDTLAAIVSRAGRADLAAGILPEIKPPTLFIVESQSPEFSEHCRTARRTLTEKKLVAVPGASCFFGEPESLENIIALTVAWFRQHLLGGTSVPQQPRERPHIDSCSFGRIRIDGKDYTDDVLVFAGRDVVNWWHKDTHFIRCGDIDQILQQEPESLIIGTGTRGNLKLESPVYSLLKNRGIRYQQETTERACVLFNQETNKGVKTAGAFHLNC